MLDDTGCDNFILFYGDLVLLQDMEADATGQAGTGIPPLAGVITTQLGDGSLAYMYIRMLEVAMFGDNNSGMMTNQGLWDLVQVSIKDGYQEDFHDERVCGIWSRFKLYSGTCPDQSGRVYLSDSRPGMVNAVPTTIHAPQSRYLPHAAAWPPHGHNQPMPVPNANSITTSFDLPTATGPGVPKIPPDILARRAQRQAQLGQGQAQGQAQGQGQGQEPGP